jgi:hypothetical protein
VREGRDGRRRKEVRMREGKEVREGLKGKR